MTGVRRNALESIQILLKQFPCVAIIGARQVGKTTLLKQLLPKAPFFDLENTIDYHRIMQDPLFFLNEFTEPLVIDEAQLCPELFNALRVKIDQNRGQCGQFLISGSSSPHLLSNISESLAGRIAIYELGTLTWEESWGKVPSSIYTQVLDHTILKSPTQIEVLSLPQIFESCLFGGYPDPFFKRNQTQFYDNWMDNYFKTYIHRDIQKLFPGLQLETYRRFISMLGFNTGKLINYSEFAQSLDVSQPTIKKYFQIAEGTFLWRMIPSFDRHRKSTKMPKGHLRDMGLISWILHLGSIDQFRSHPSYGHLWEASVIEQLLKGFSETLTPLSYTHFRTKHQAEIDLVIEGKFGVIPIEIKSGATLRSQQLTTIKSFIEDENCPFGLIINQADEIVKLGPRLIQLPAKFL